jgi:predicted ATPase/class 3 adenylate cyclase
MNEIPQSGILTFLFTDLEESTRLWEHFPEAMRPALARHDALLKLAVESHRGLIIKTTGDGLHAVFESPIDGVAAALAGQLAIRAASWPAETGPLKVRMGLHTGESQFRDGDYYGAVVNLAASLTGLGFGGQVLLSGVAAALVKKTLPPEGLLADLGEHRLKGVSAPEQVFQLIHPDLEAEFPPLKSLGSFKHNLPRQLSSFIGRKKELADVMRLLASSQLLTLLGPGGTGKTRLMLQVAEEVIEDYPDGVWLVELASLTDPELIPERVAAALNVQERTDRSMGDALLDFLSRKDLLLLLDNVEHIVRESAAFTENLLGHCPHLKVLVTGREALFIAGEMTVQVPSLSLPDLNQNGDQLDRLAECEAIQLFLERARAVRPDFALRHNNANAIVEIVRRLDGIPLALELAAARLRMLTVEKIAGRLSGRFRLLTGGRRTALPRQQTLEALIDWSWKLLDEGEHILLRRLSVFSGGWSLEAAEAICGFEPLDAADVFDNLDQLINKSLVTVAYLPEGEPRYGMLESIRQFARNHLFEADEGEALRDRHAEYFVAFTHTADGELSKRGMMIWVRQLRRDLDNLRGVMEWTLEERPELVLRLVGHLRHNYGLWMTPREARSWLTRAIDRTRRPFEAGDQHIPASDFIRALIALGITLVTQGDNVRAGVVFREAVTLARTHGEDRLMTCAIPLNALTMAFRVTPDIIREVEEAIHVCRQNGYQDELAQNLVFAGGVKYLLGGDIEKGQADLEEAFQIRLELGSDRGIAAVLETRSGLAFYREDWDTALKFAVQAVEKYEEMEGQHGINMNQSRVAHILRKMGRLSKAESAYRETILAWQEQAHFPAVAHQLECFGYIALAQEEYGRAARLLGAAGEARRRLDALSVDPREITELEKAVSKLAETMEVAERDQGMTEGAKMTLDEAVLLALRQ